MKEIFIHVKFTEEEENRIAELTAFNTSGNRSQLIRMALRRAVLQPDRWDLTVEAPEGRQSDQPVQIKCSVEERDDLDRLAATYANGNRSELIRRVVNLVFAKPGDFGLLDPKDFAKREGQEGKA